MSSWNAWSTATRPLTPQQGLTGYNTDLAMNETWDGLAWVPGGGFYPPLASTIPLRGTKAEILAGFVSPGGVLQGTTDITVGGLYGVGGVLDGQVLSLNVNGGGGGFDVDAFNKQQVEMRTGFYERNHVPVFVGRGRFVDAHSLEVSEGNSARQQLTAGAFVIATGSRPYRPPDVLVAAGRQHVTTRRLLTLLVLLLQPVPHSRQVLERLRVFIREYSTTPLNCNDELLQPLNYSLVHPVPPPS